MDGGHHIAEHGNKPSPFASTGAAFSGECCAHSPNSRGSLCSLCSVARAGRSVPQQGRAGGDSKSTGLKAQHAVKMQLETNFKCC